MLCVAASSFLLPTPLAYAAPEEHAEAAATEEKTEQASTPEATAPAAAVAESFKAPALEVRSRPAFGATVGKIEKYTVPTPTTVNRTAVNIGWCVAGALALMTIVLAYRMARVRDGAGQSRTAFTIASKLTVGFGAMATVMALVGTLGISGMCSLRSADAELSDAVDDADLLANIQSEVLQTRIAVKNYILQQSDNSLNAYSLHATTASDRIEACKEAIKNPERVHLTNEVREKFAEYDKVFADVVKLSDTAAAIQSTQMAPAAGQATKMFRTIAQTCTDQAKRASGAESSRLLNEALLAAESDEHLQAARLGYFKYLSTGDVKFVAEAMKDLDAGRQTLKRLNAMARDPQHRALIASANEAFDFWAARATEGSGKRQQAEELISTRLDKLGPEIAANGAKLVESINATRSQVEDRAAAVASQIFMFSIVSCVIAVVIAGFVGAFIIRTITSGTSMMVDRLRDIAQGEGDLTRRVEVTRSDELGELARWFNTFIEKVHTIVKEVAQATNEVAAASTEIAASSEEMSASAGEVARQAAGANQVAEESRELARAGGDIVAQTVSGIQSVNASVNESAQGVKRLGERSDQIGEIIKVINDIADQTNLLALNAAIEAARAGEHGRGFAVVADEVRKLAERTTKSTEQVGESIRSIQEETVASVQRMDAGATEVAKGVESANHAGESLGQIVTKAESVATMIRAITAAAEEAGAGSQQAASAASQLSAKAEQLQALVGQFKV
jgi:methyl-accepting chemotaxis protein